MQVQIAFMYVDRKQLEAFHRGMQHFRITFICSNNVFMLSDMSIRKETSAPETISIKQMLRSLFMQMFCVMNWVKIKAGKIDKDFLCVKETKTTKISIFHLQVYNLRRIEIKIHLVVHQLTRDSDFDLTFWKDYNYKATSLA